MEGILGVSKIVERMHKAGFCWPTLHFEVDTFMKSYDTLQRLGNILRRHGMPLNNIIECEIFDVRGADFMGPFASAYRHKYILVSIDSGFKWIEKVASPTKDHHVVIKLFKKVIFPRFVVLKAAISDGGPHFMHNVLNKLVNKCRVTYKVRAPITHKLKAKRRWRIRK